MEHMEQIFGSFMLNQVPPFQLKGEGANGNGEIDGNMNDEI